RGPPADRPMRNLELDSSGVVGPERHCLQHAPIQLQHSAIHRHTRDGAMAEHAERLHEQLETRPTEQSHDGARHYHAPDENDAARNHREMFPSPPVELIAIPPRRHLGTPRLTHPHQRRALLHSREPDVVRRHAKLRVAKQPLTLLDRLPSLLERTEIPSLTRAAHDPQAALRGVERQATADREVLDRLVLPEARMTENAGGIQLRP